jgi:hypothetical protein
MRHGCEYIPVAPDFASCVVSVNEKAGVMRAIIPAEKGAEFAKYLSARSFEVAK